MPQQNTEINIHGARAKWMADILVKNGATMLRTDDISNYVFVNDEKFINALAVLQVTIREGFYNIKTKEVKSE